MVAHISSKNLSSKNLSPQNPLSTNPAPKKLLVIDVMAMAYRSYYSGGASQLRTSAGVPMSVVFHSAKFLIKLLQDKAPDYIVLATDSQEKTFRHKLYSGYKASRKTPPQEFVEQLPYLFKMFDCMGLTVLGEPGYEADDLIGSLVTQYAHAQCQAIIVSGDKDFAQLVNDHVSLLQPKSKQPHHHLTVDGVKKRYGLYPHQIVDFLAIQGDSSDNVPGVKGIGEKGAQNLLAQFESLEGVYARLDEVANARTRGLLVTHKDMACLSKTLVSIKTDISLTLDWEDIHRSTQSGLSSPKLHAFFKEYEFYTLLGKHSSGRGGGYGLNGWEVHGHAAI